MARPEDTDATKEVYTYNNLSQLTSKRTHSGKTINYTYDLLGNLLTTTSGNEQIVHEYNVLGQVTSSTRKKNNVDDSKVTFAYDSVGRVTEENTYDYAENIRYKVCYTYTGDTLATQKVYKYLGNMTNESNSTLVVQESFNYNSNKQITSKVYDAFNLISQYEYDNNGNLIHTKINGDFGDVVEEKTYTPTNSVASITHYETWNNSENSSITRSEEYTYDLAGRLYEEKKLKTLSAGYNETTNPLVPYERSVYGYDSVGRFSSQQYYTYSADSSGNLVQTSPWSIQTSFLGINNLETEYKTYANGQYGYYGYALDDNGRVTEQHQYDDVAQFSERTTYTYDTDGNRITKISDAERHIYSYSQFGELTGVTKTVYDNPGVGITTNIAYRYDALGRRIHKTVGEECYSSAYIGSNIVYENVYMQGDLYGTSYRHFHGVSGYEGSTIWGAPFIARKNYKGDVIAYIYYPTHEIIEQNYSNYGDALSERTYDYYPLPPYGYSSGYTDSETGLQYLINRYYDPTASRFIQEDNNFIDGYNLYAYCGNDPINYTDPFGRCCGFPTKWNTELTSNPYFSYSSQGVWWGTLCLEYDKHHAMKLEKENAAKSAKNSYGTLVYQNIEYPISLPITDGTSQYVNKWQIVHKQTIVMYDIDWLKVWAEMQLEDYQFSNGGLNALCSITGIISTIDRNTLQTYITVKLLQDNAGNRKSTISLSNNIVKELTAEYGGSTVTRNMSAWEIEKITKTELENGMYTIKQTVAPQHKMDNSYAYIWCDGKNIMSKPYILPQDTIAVKKWFSGGNWINIPINRQSSAVSIDMSLDILTNLAMYGMTIK